jgi:hypothetical protein
LMREIKSLTSLLYTRTLFSFIFIFYLFSFVTINLSATMKYAYTSFLC